MAVEYIGRKNDDGTNLGQSASDKIAFYGATTVAQQATAAAGTNAATTQTLCNALKLAFDNLGLTA